jgi:hypothetical protein
MVDAWYAYAPQWWRGHWGSRIGFSCVVPFDALLDAGGYAVLAGLPSRAPPDAYSWFGLDRQIARGPNETALGYVARLIQWLDIWRHAGSSTTVLLATLAYLTPLAPQVSTVSWPGSGTFPSWDTYFAGDVPFPPGQSIPTPPYHQNVQTGIWQWDTLLVPYYAPFMWWRKWLIIQSSGPQAPWSPPTAQWASGGSLTTAIVADATYGKVIECTAPASPGPNSFNWGDGTCWGWSGTTDQSTSLTAIVTEWKSAGCWYPWILVTYDPTWFQPANNNQGVDCPDGAWGYCGRIQSDPTYGAAWGTTRPSCSTATMIIGSSDGGGVLGLG